MRYMKGCDNEGLAMGWTPEWMGPLTEMEEGLSEGDYWRGRLKLCEGKSRREEMIRMKDQGIIGAEDSNET